MKLPHPPQFARRASFAAPVALVAALAVTAIAPAQAAYEYRIPLKGLRVQTVNPLALSLAAANLPEAIVGAPYAAYDFKALLTLTGSNAPPLSAVGWGALSPLPAGLTLSADGVLTGTPTLKNEAGAAFQVQAGYQAATTQQGYTLRILDPLVSLASATIPAGTVGQAFSYDFKTKLSVSGDPNYNANLATFSSSGALPSGLTLAENGVVSGTPTTKNTTGTSFQVIAAYKTRTGQQAYTIVVNGVMLQVTKISVGGLHSCAVTTLGAVKCWGGNADGQLGDSTTTDRNAPVAVSGLGGGVAQLAAGVYHTCAITTANAVLCWGRNNYGQLGDGTTTNRATPVAVSGLASDVEALALGQFHTCAVTTAGAAKCWGWNGWGQLGDGGANTNRSTPVGVSGLSSGVASISAGGSHTCAALTNGASLCWGSNTYGELGDGTNTYRNVPGGIAGLSTGVKAVALGYNHSCAILSDSSAKCWGHNGYGQLGNGTATHSNVPVTVTGFSSGGATISLGAEHTCAVTTAGAAKCWGRNRYGQLGDGTTTDRWTPITVSGLGSGVQLVGAGFNHSCAMLASGAAKCWGAGGVGQLGDGATANRSTPVDVSP